jgi:hypothetical protein
VDGERSKERRRNVPTGLLDPGFAEKNVADNALVDRRD